MGKYFQRGKLIKKENIQYAQLIKEGKMEGHVNFTND